jgi:hypothetical protein
MLTTFCKAGFDMAPKKVGVFNYLFAKQEQFAKQSIEYKPGEEGTIKANEREDALEDIHKFDGTFSDDTAKIKKGLKRAMTAFGRLVEKFDREHPTYSKDEADIMKALIASNNEDVDGDHVDSTATQSDTPAQFEQSAMELQREWMQSSSFEGRQYCPKLLNLLKKSCSAPPAVHVPTQKPTRMVPKALLAAMEEEEKIYDQEGKHP